MSEDRATMDHDALLGSEDDYREATDYCPPEPHGYSIAGKAGPEFADQVKLVDWHLKKASELEAVTAAIVAPFDEELERLAAETARLLGEREALVRVRQRDVDWHKSQVEWWFLDQNVRETTGKASLALPYGEIKSRQSKGKTEVNEEEIIRLWREEPEAYADCIKESVDKGNVRKRFALLESGEVEDTATGEILPQGLITQVEPPSVSVSVELTGKPKGEV